MTIDVDDFKTSEERGDFVFKVFGIIAAQLVVTSAFGFFAVTTFGAAFYAGHLWLVFISLAASFAALIALTCFRHLAREFPRNYLLLLLFTAAEGYCVGFVCSVYTARSVLLAFAVTSAIVLALAVYALTTKRDYTVCGGLLVTLLFGLIGFGLLTWVVKSEVLDSLYAACGAVLFGFFLIFDIQMVMHKYEVDDYILAAMSIYLDVINIFLKILRLLGEKK